MLGEILTTAATCFAITLFGLALGFVFLQVQANFNNFRHSGGRTASGMCSNSNFKTLAEEIITN